MPKAKTDQSVEEVTHGPFKAVVRMNRQTGIFSCEYGPDKFGNQSLPAVRSWAREKLRELSSIKWEPLMVVNFDASDTRVNNLTNCSNIACYMERYWLAWDGKKWITCPWVVLPSGTSLCSPHATSEMEQDDYPMSPVDLMAERIRNSREFCEAKGVVQIKWPLIGSHLDDKVYYIQYTEERWATLVGIIAKIRELRAGINRLLTSEQGWLQLAVVAQNNLLTDQKSPLTASDPTSAEQSQAAELSAGRSATHYRH